MKYSKNKICSEKKTFFVVVVKLFPILYVCTSYRVAANDDNRIPRHSGLMATDGEKNS